MWRHGHITAENKGDNQLRCGGLAVSTFTIKLRDSHSHRSKEIGSFDYDRTRINYLLQLCT